MCSARIESPRVELLHDHITAVKELVAFTAGFGDQSAADTFVPHSLRVDVACSKVYTGPSRL